MTTTEWPIDFFDALLCGLQKIASDDPNNLRTDRFRKAGERASPTRDRTDELTALDAASALPTEYPGWMVGFQHRDRWLEGMDRP